MKKSHLAVLIITLAAGGLVGGLFLSRHLGHEHRVILTKPRSQPPAAPLATHRPAFSLPDINGKTHSISQWDGKVVMLNFWATWCPPCRHEIPAFIKLQKAFKKKGFTVVGVAIDTAQNVRDFIDPMGVDYPILHGQNKAIEIAKAYGDRLGVLPYTVIIDRTGKVVFRHPTGLTYAEAERAIKRVL